jgi:hypothetical protein
MLGIVISGNLAMTFVFWELVGICSYFLIGFYIERHSASTAANKAFIVNRVGDFGMLIGLMAIWSTLGTFSFGDMKDATARQRASSASSHGQNDYDSRDGRHDRFERDAVTAAVIGRQPAGVTRREPTRPMPASCHWLLFIAGGMFAAALQSASSRCTWLRRDGRPDPVSAPCIRRRWLPPACFWWAACIRFSRPRRCW